MAAYITVGATTTHGGKVISGSPHTTHNGIPISRKGDKVVCKKCKKLTTILTGDASFIVDGAPIARAGDVTSCGAKLIAVQQSFCESDFEVMSVEQPAPIQFPKSDPESLFASLAASDDKDSEDEMSDDDLWVWVDVSTEQALEEGGLWAGPGMYGTDEIPGSSAARERARLQGIEDRRQPVGNNDYVNFTKDGNHAYDYISPPVCSIHDPNCSIKSVVNFLNKKGVYPKQKTPISPGRNNVSNADIPGPWGEDSIQSSGLYDSAGNQIGVRNETLENHKLHPGVVERRVILKGSNIHILTEGGGSGLLGGPNVLLRANTWGRVDQVVIDEFKK
ncbi:PAAR domain-containing protein [Psychrobacter sp. AOP7-D1-15]|uniref:PAAR domain-containing protein n=2 Tax=Psychrobacter TaxID=497 RepID=UPI00186926BE|nr:PAAR domain-containing protein [Psychrobacter sp. FME61]